MQVTRIRRYPVKSFRGEDVERADVEPWGLAGDRRWMVVDENGMAITAREVNAMLLITPTLTGDGLRLHADGAEPLDVVRPPDSSQVPVQVWSSELTAAEAAADSTAWLSGILGRTARLVYLDDPARRPTSRDYSEPDDRVSFADGYPLLLTTEESLDAVNEALPEGHDPLTMVRFRPSIVMSGAPAWAEDDWRRIRVGEVTLRAVKGCARCVMTTVDPDTGERGKEPTATLARLRRFDGAVWFGVNLIPDDVGTVQVGDGVEVLDAVEPGAGPIRVPRRNPVDAPQ